MDIDDLLNEQISEFSRNFASALRKMMKEVVVQATRLTPSGSQELTAPVLDESGAAPLLPLPTVDRTAEAQAAKTEPAIPVLQYFQAEPLRQLPRQEAPAPPITDSAPPTPSLPPPIPPTPFHPDVGSTLPPPIPMRDVSARIDELNRERAADRSHDRIEAVRSQTESLDRTDQELYDMLLQQGYRDREHRHRMYQMQQRMLQDQNADYRRLEMLYHQMERSRENVSDVNI